MKKLNLSQVAEFVNQQGPDTKIYLGVDSERFRIDGVWHADFIRVVVVHIDGRHGCKVFGEVIRERDYDHKPSKPSYRLMTEVYKASELYLSLAPLIPDREIQVHLDVNPGEEFASSSIIQQAVGYIRGTCNVIPLVKPEAFAASYAADRFKSYAA
jgi:predicted RNase H-related nuclease YkuK (DUF458 family)